MRVIRGQRKPPQMSSARFEESLIVAATMRLPRTTHSMLHRSETTTHLSSNHRST